VQALFAGQGYSARIEMQQDVEDEVLYVLKIIRVDRGSRVPGSTEQLEDNNDTIRDEDNVPDRHPLIKSGVSPWKNADRIRPAVAKKIGQGQLLPAWHDRISGILCIITIRAFLWF
jgi:hypothetical protein